MRIHKLKAYIVVTIESECAAAILYNCCSCSSLEAFDLSCLNLIKFTAAFNAIFSGLVLLLTVRMWWQVITVVTSAHWCSGFNMCKRTTPFSPVSDVSPMWITMHCLQVSPLQSYMTQIVCTVLPSSVNQRFAHKQGFSILMCVYNDTMHQNLCISDAAFQIIMTPKLILLILKYLTFLHRYTWCTCTKCRTRAFLTPSPGNCPARSESPK